VSGASKTAFNERLKAVTTLITDPRSDGSYSDRDEETRAAVATFKASPVWGVGPGLNYQYTAIGSGPKQLRNLDTGVSFLSKFGLVGVLLLGSALTWLWRRLPSMRGGNVAADSLWVLLAFTAITLPLRIPTEDPGFTYGFMLLLALCWKADASDANRVAVK
jgi:hypothetical protein